MKASWGEKRVEEEKDRYYVLIMRLMKGGKRGVGK